MGWKSTLLPQVEHHFRWLSRAIADVDDASARFELAPGRPSIAWLLGHLIVGADSIATAVAGLPAGLGPGFAQRHGSTHWGVSDAREWEQLRVQWEQVAVRTGQGVAALEEADFERRPAIEVLPQFADRLSTRHAFLTGEVFHFAYHLGQIGALRAAQGLGWD